MDYSVDITANTYEFGDANYSPTGAFDNNLTGGSANDGSWYAYSGGAYQTFGVIGQDFGAGNEKIIACYRICSNGSSTAYNPEDWTFEGSNDGSNWDVLDTQTGMSAGLGTHAWNEFPITNSTAYRYYRLNITANGGGSYLVIQEIEMLLEGSTKVTTILSGVVRMPSAQGLAFRELKLRRDVLLFERLGSILSACDASLLVAANGVISGTVAVSGVPSQRRVTLFSHLSLRPVASCWSDAETGAYTFTGLLPGRKYLVVCDDYTQTYNAAVADWVVAE